MYETYPIPLPTHETPTHLQVYHAENTHNAQQADRSARRAIFSARNLEGNL